MACRTSTVNDSPISSVSATPVQQNMVPPVSSQASNNTNMNQEMKSSPTTVPNNPSVSTNNPHSIKSLNKQRLQELVREVDPNEQLDEDVEEVLLQITDDFIENVITTSCMLAKHRKSNTLEVKDVQLALEKNWNMWVPGFGSDELRQYKKSSTTEAHKQRMALIRKALKK